VLSRRTQLTRPNGVTTNYSYDSVSHLLSVLHQEGSTTLDGASYTYDFAGNRTSKTNYLNGTTWNYDYDAIYELLQVTHGGSTKESFSYDAVGNRLSSLSVPSYSYNSSNELTANSNGSYTYDANGNTLSDPSGKSYSWDFENRLTQAVVPGTGTVTFKYDPFGRRIYKQSPNATSIFVYDGVRLVETINASGSEVASYTEGPLIDEPLAELRGSTTDYYEADGLGSITSLSNSAGALANTYTYDSFGNTTASTGTLRNYFQYTAREFDSETNLYFYRARYFDPSAGRFLSEDPIRFFQGPSFYRYVDNNLLNLTDSTGLQAQMPGNLPPGEPQVYWGPFADGFAEALNRLNNANCAEQFEPSCHEGPYTTGANQMQNTTYRFLPLPQGAGAGAQTVDSTNVQINSLGLYMTATGGGIRLPNGFTCNLGSITNVRAFILLHELGHQLSGNTGFTPDVDAATNSSHSMRIIKACFQCGN
jgi:RHS repeat-associated protein